MNTTAIGIVAIIGWVIVSVAGKLTRKTQDKAAQRAQQHQQQLEAELLQLKERVAVLESLVTDPKQELRQQFRELG